MPCYSFALGREPRISQTEIKAIFSLWKINCREKLVSHYLLIETHDELDIDALQERLGGTVKIGEALPVSSSIDKVILDHLCQTNGKIVFSLESPSGPKHALTLKKKLQSLRRPVRYVPPKNTATILHNHLVEKQSDLAIIDGRVYMTRAIQPIEELGERDFGRPGRNSYGGMLPPKLAKILINLAQIDQHLPILDPFCGSGTILTEAALMGYVSLIGSDLDQAAVDATRKNLDWVKTKYGIKNLTISLLRSAIDDLSAHLESKSFAAIVTEPYLGVPLRGRETKAFLAKQAAELKKSYIAAFQSFHKLLAPAGTVVCVLPAFVLESGWLRIDCQNEIEKLGFKTTPLGKTEPYLLYARPNQRVGREIWKFTRV